MIWEMMILELVLGDDVGGIKPPAGGRKRQTPSRAKLVEM